MHHFQRHSPAGNISATAVDISKKPVPLGALASSKEKEKKQALQFSKDGCVSHMVGKQEKWPSRVSVCAVT